MKARAGDIARLLHGRPEGTGFLCRCPVPTHGKRRGDMRPSLGVSDGREVWWFIVLPDVGLLRFFAP